MEKYKMNIAEQKACARKKRYHSQRHAKKINKSLGYQSMHVYHCPVCNGFHLGHKVNQNRLGNIMESVAKELRMHT